MPRQKVKQSGLEGSYSDSLYFEWYVIMDDATEFSMFGADGSETSWRDVLDYTPTTSNIDKVGLRSFSDAKAALINNHQDHQLTVLASSRVNFQKKLTAPQKGFVPYMMRRKHHADGYIQQFFVVSYDKDSSVFFIINNQGAWQQGDNKLLQWV